MPHSENPPPREKSDGGFQDRHILVGRCKEVLKRFEVANVA